MAILFVADLNFDRPGARLLPAGVSGDGRALTQRLCAMWRARVKREDTVWILGNVGNPVHLADLPGTKHLVRGADDPPAWDCLATRRYASVTERGLLSTPFGDIALVSGGTIGTDATIVLHGAADVVAPADVAHLCVSAERTGWGPVGLDMVGAMVFRMREAA